MLSYRITNLNLADFGGLRGLIFFLTLLVFVNKAEAATYYVAINGNDNDSGSEARPWQTFSKAWTVLQPGDSLIVKDGTYDQTVYPTVSGTASSYITVKSQNDGGAIMDGQGVGPGIEIQNRAYLAIEGFTVINPGEAPAVYVGAPDGNFTGTHHIILRRIGARGGSNLYNAGAAIEIARSKNVIVEDSYAYGFGRYAVSAYGSQYVTMRRVVSRWDRWDGTGYKPCDPTYSLGVYNTHDSIFENILLMDQGTKECGDHGALYVPGNDNGNTAPYTDSSNNKFYGVIALNNNGGGLQIEPNGGSNNVFNNVVSWGNYYGISVNRAEGDTVFNHATIGANESGGWSGSATDVINSLGYNNSSGFSGEISTGYSNIYNSGSSSGTQNISQDPNLKYLTRLEELAPGKGTANDGGDRAATVVSRYIDGVLTSVPLWPWPGEIRIKRDMCSGDFLAVVGRTGYDLPGWCQSEKTLTRYVWEYLGNQIPCEIYGTCGGDETASANPGGLSVR